MTEQGCLQSRVSRLERTNRWLWVAVLGVAACFGLAASGPGAGSRAVLEGRALRLTDGEGRTLVELTTEDGVPALYFRDSEGRDRIVLRHATEESGLFVRDERGDSRIGIAQFAHGGGGVALHGPELKGAAVLYFKKSASLTLYDADGNAVSRLPSRAAEGGD